MASQSQGRGSQKAGGPDKKAQLSDPEIQKKGCDLAFYLLCREKHREIHKRTDLMKAVDLNGRRKEDQDRAIEIAGNHLRHIFGIKMHQLNAEDHGPKYKDMYMLVNELKTALKASDLDEAEMDVLDKKEKACTGLLFVILGLIWMGNGKIREDSLDAFLKQVGLIKMDDLNVSKTRSTTRSRRSNEADDKKSEMIKETFGDVKNLILNEWCKKQHYLQAEKIPDCEDGEPIHEIRWGIRADCEVRKSQLLRIISQIYGCKPSEFKQQYDEAIEEEGGNAFDDELEAENEQDGEEEPMDTSV